MAFAHKIHPKNDVKKPIAISAGKATEKKIGEKFQETPNSNVITNTNAKDIMDHIVMDDPDLLDELDFEALIENEINEVPENDPQDFRERILKTFADYGPPYTKHPKFLSGNLNDECSHPVEKLYKVHTLLMERANPNIRDPHDFYFGPMHWCARNLHLTVMRMLRIAGAKIDISNEFDQTPLIICSLIRRAPDKIKMKQKMMKYLIEHGANINHIDRSGNSVIDYETMSGDLEMVNFLIEKGAKVMRENRILAAKRINILEYVKDNGELYRVLNKKLKEEEEEWLKQVAAKEKEMSLAEEQHRRKKLRAYLDKKRKKRIAKIEQAKFEEKRAIHERQVRESIEKDIKEEETRKKALVHSQGEWVQVKNEIGDDGGGGGGGGGWIWKQRKDKILPYQQENFVEKCKNQIQDLREFYDKDSYDEKWKHATRKALGMSSQIEIEWKKSKPFEAACAQMAKMIPSTASSSIYSRETEDETTVETIQNEYEKELEGEENLEELFSQFKFS